MSNTDLDNTLHEIQQYKTAFINKFNQKGLKIGTNASLYQALNATSLVPGLNESQELLSRVLYIIGTKSQSDSQVPGSDSTPATSDSASQESAFDLAPYADLICKSSPTLTTPEGIDIGYIQVCSVGASYGDGYGECSISRTRYNYSSLIVRQGNPVSIGVYSISSQTGYDYSEWDGATIPQVDPSSIPLESPSSYSDYIINMMGSFRYDTNFQNNAQATACANGQSLKYNFYIAGNSAYQKWMGWMQPRITWTDDGSNLTGIIDLSSFNRTFESGDTQIKDQDGSKSYSHYWVTINFNPNKTIALQWSK